MSIVPPTTHPSVDLGSDVEPWQQVLGTATRVVVGGGTVIIGVLALTIALFDPSDLTFLSFALMLTLGGVLLVALPRLRTRAGVPAGVAGGATALGGLAAGLLVNAEHGGSRIWGYPLTWITTDGTGAGLARALPWRSTAHVDVVYAGGSVIFWGYAGLLVGVGVGLVHRLWHDRRAA